MDPESHNYFSLRLYPRLLTEPHSKRPSFNKAKLKTISKSVFKVLIGLIRDNNSWKGIIKLCEIFSKLVIYRADFLKKKVSCRVSSNRTCCESHLDLIKIRERKSKNIILSLAEERRYYDRNLMIRSKNIKQDVTNALGPGRGHYAYLSVCPNKHIQSTLFHTLDHRPFPLRKHLILLGKAIGTDRTADW